MKVLVLFVRIPENSYPRLKRLLHRNSAQIGMTIIKEGVHNDSSTSRDPIAIFTWQAPASLHPKQVIAIMTYCERASATVLEMCYVEDVDTDDDDDVTDESATPAIPLRLHAAPQLRLIVNDDDTDR